MAVAFGEDQALTFSSSGRATTWCIGSVLSVIALYRFAPAADNSVGREDENKMAETSHFTSLRFHHYKAFREYSLRLLGWGRAAPCT